MLMTLKHNVVDRAVVAAKLLMGALTIGEKVEDPDSYIKVNQVYDADFVAFVCAWQKRHDLTSDGVIGKKTWTKLASEQSTCSTRKNATSGQTLALQILLDSKLTCDGIFGQRTKSAVAVFQDAKKLTVDGICGPKTWAALIGTAEAEVVPSSGTVTPEPGKFKSTVNYKQHDPRWGKNNYTSCGNKSQTMSNSGCGPTAMANVIAALVDASVTPWDMAQLALKWGDRTKSSGTATSFFQHVQKHYGFKKMVGAGSLEALKACLDAGGYVVCRMGPGYWTNGGHYITAWKYDKDYIYCNDPSSPTSTKAERKYQKQSDFLKQRKDFWCFYPEREGQENTANDDKVKAIIDISKHDGMIDFSVLKQYVSLVIARCSLGSDLDVRFDEYAQAMNRHGIPFGVYCYSYARDVAKANDEAEKMLQYAAKYKPLFYVMDAEEDCITEETIAAFWEALHAKGVRTGCYVAHHLYKQYNFESVAGLFDFVWIPRYGANDGTLEGTIKPKYPCDLWQYTSQGHVPGMSDSEDVDLNVITGDGHDLEWFLGGE